MVCEARGPFGDGASGPRLKAVKKNEERQKMTDEELAQMSLERLLYYVLMGEGRN